MMTPSERQELGTASFACGSEAVPCSQSLHGPPRVRHRYDAQRTRPSSAALLDETLWGDCSFEFDDDERDLGPSVCGSEPKLWVHCRAEPEGGCTDRASLPARSPSPERF